MEHALKVLSGRLRRRLSEGKAVSKFPQVVWQKGCERVVQKDRETLAVEVSHRNALGDENWMPALPDTVADAIAQALLDRLNYEDADDGTDG